MSSKNILKLFENLSLDEERRAAVAAIPEPAPRYLIAMTPRSGSSHLCDVLKNTKLLGRPGEMVSQMFIPNILKSAPAATPDEYLAQVMRVVRTRNGVSGMKASWFQFNDFRGAMQDESVFRSYRFIYLTRRDLAAQAVSLYCATSSNVFHTNVEHTTTEREKLANLDYDFQAIKRWHEHILAQELGWQAYFAKHNIFPLSINYEEIEHDVTAVVKRIAHFVGRPRAGESATSESIFRKIGDRRNVEWAARFTLELDAERRVDKAPAAAA
ncbi:Stf0 family sulfotransferase [Zoogloea sp.]|uniref:Stf0 family sulfotransferase n=1 Tax=Zoogloea sp. TaxID=49181 RepID=UPI001AD41BB4|nr:Stf0 family sulfotransferase [Zoogloea sp.]MBN8285750.1 sulfotransferase domain-containing protein [Zoogloea sp.]